LNQLSYPLQILYSHRGRTRPACGPQKLIDPWLDVAWVTWPDFEILGPLYNFWTNWAIHVTFGTYDGPLMRADHKTTPKWAWSWSRDPISKHWETLYNFWMNWAIRFKFGTNIENGPLLRTDHKVNLKWAWPGSRDSISKFWDPYNFWTDTSIPLKFGIQIKDGPFLRTDHKLSCVGCSWLVFALHWQNSKRKSEEY